MGDGTVLCQLIEKARSHKSLGPARSGLASKFSLRRAVITFLLYSTVFLGYVKNLLTAVLPCSFEERMTAVQRR